MSLYLKSLYSLLLFLLLFSNKGNAQRNYLGLAYNFHVLTSQDYFAYRFSTLGVNYRHFFNEKRFMLNHAIGVNFNQALGTSSTDIHQINYMSYNFNRKGRVNMHVGPMFAMGMSQQNFRNDVFRENRMFVGLGFVAGVGVKLTRNICLYVDQFASQEYNIYRFSSALSKPPISFGNNSFNLYSSVSVSLLSF